MKRLLIVSMLTVAGCRHYACPSGEPGYVVQPEYVIQPAPLEYPLFLDRPVIERPTTAVEQNATSAVAKLKADQIQGAQGINAVLLRDLIKAAAPDMKLTVDEKSPPKVEQDRVIVDYEPVPSGEYMYTHRVIANIISVRKEVSFTVSTTVYRDEAGRRVYYIAPDESPRQVVAALTKALGR